MKKKLWWIALDQETKKLVEKLSKRDQRNFRQVITYALKLYDAGDVK